MKDCEDIVFAVLEGTASGEGKKNQNAKRKLPNRGSIEGLPVIIFIKD